MSALIVAVGLPEVANTYFLFLATEIVILASACLGLIMLLGWAGQLSMAHPGFFAIGAYGTAYLSSHGVPWPIAVFLSLILCASAGLLVAGPTFKLQGFYLAISTLAFAVLVQQLIIQMPALTGGAAGLPVDLLRIGDFTHDVSLWYLTAGVAVVLFSTTAVLDRSHVGRSLRAVRDMELAMAALGLSARSWKAVGFVLSAIIAGTSGALWAQLATYITPDSFGFPLLIQFLVIAFVGGIRYLSGPLIGALFVIATMEVLQRATAWQHFVFAIALILSVRFLPNGLASLPAQFVRRRTASSTMGSRGEQSITASRPETERATDEQPV